MARNQTSIALGTHAAWSVAPLVVCLALVAGLHGSRADLPLGGDSLGYVIVNTVWRVEQGTVFCPPWHDPGHPALLYSVLAAAWWIAGSSALWVSHLVQWVYMAFLAGGVWGIGRMVAPRHRVVAAAGVAMVLLHPHFHTLSNTLDFEVPMVAAMAWMILGFYRRKPAVYTAALAFLLMTKASATASVAIFGLVELVLLPLGVALARPAGRAVLLRWWRRWMAWSIVGGVPFLIWLVVHRVHQGFWVQSDTFAITTRFEFTAQRLHDGWLAIYWTMFLREGNVWALWTSAALVLMGIATWLLVPGGRNGLARQAGIRPLWALVLSMVLQSVLTLVLYVFKVQLLGRYLLPVDLMIVIVAMAGGAMAVGAAEQVRRRYARVTILAGATTLLLLTAASYALRLNPRNVDYLTTLPTPWRDSMRNDHGIGSELNSELYEQLDVTRRAARRLVRTIEKRGAPAKVNALYPYHLMLTLPQAGYVDEPLDVVSFYTFDDFMRLDWDYFFNGIHDGLWSQTGGGIPSPSRPVYLDHRFDTEEPFNQGYAVVIWYAPR